VREVEVGDTARRSMLVTDEQIELFARLSGDRNPLHFDEDFARRTKFGRRVVHGGVTAAPVHPGDTITADLVVLKAREDKPVHTVAVKVTRQDGVSVLEGECVVYVMRTQG
jgi:acyl dehydratase